jgi:hypothetical protein
MSDKMTILPRVQAKAGMSVYDMQQKGNVLQKKYAYIFDSDGNGVFDAKEAKLFNSSILKQESNGELTIWTSFTSGKKKTVMNEWSLQNDCRLKLERDGNKEYLRNIDSPYKNNVSYETEADGKYEITAGEAEDPNGYYVVSGNVTKYYDENNRLTGSVERKDGKEYYKNSKGNVLYSVRGNEESVEQYYDDKNILRYEIKHNPDSDDKVTIYEYSEKGELINRFDDSYFSSTDAFDPHTDLFKPLKEFMESSYYMPKE